MAGISEEKGTEFVSKFKEFLRRKYYKDMIKAMQEGRALVVSFRVLDKYSPEFGEMLLKNPDDMFSICNEAAKDIDLPEPVRIRFTNLPGLVNIRDLRSRHIDKFISTEGTVRRASEIRPEIVEIIWECPECGDMIHQERKGNFIFKPFQCNCGNRAGFKQAGKKMIDTRWIVIEEPFELTEGEKPSQVHVLLTEDLVSTDCRGITDPGNRLKIFGVLKDIPKGKFSSVKLDFYMNANYFEPTEVGWEKVLVTPEDEKEIKKVSKDPMIYDKLVDSVAPSLYGMREIKEAIILQLFGGVPRTLEDKTTFRGVIHLLLIGEPASGKTQLLKLIPDIVPRGKYVSGKGVTGVGLTASVTRDEQFMGGWVLEAGAIVLANKGLISIDEFEKMNPDDQVAMHEAMESGTVSIAKASIVATLPAHTSILAGGNPKFSRFDPYMPIAKQINISDTLLTRFDLKFILKDIPNVEEDKKIVDHILNTREGGYEPSRPKFSPQFIRKYVAYAKDKHKPYMTKEAGKTLRDFYLQTRKKAQGGNSPIPISLRQFEGLIRLSEASAKIQLSDKIRKEDTQRAIRLMRFSLRQLGLDPESGMIDIDRSEGITTSAERSTIRIIMDIIDEFSEKKKEILMENIRKEADKHKIKNCDEIIERLKRDGMLYEPSPGYVQKV